ncbi:MBL fold metallo-hydrolase [SAR202 cluster bacterium AD-804-J14_MRT_500m]|nr:MBL fold metallo-hydrolase [SAR202 cluster bacterium AD-804-J14_MRT_500m]
MTESIWIGNCQVWSLLDMIPPPYAVDDFFPSVPVAAWDPYRELALTAVGELQLYYGCFAVRSQGKLAVIDTGMGPGPHPERGNRRGDLINAMSVEGLRPEDVDFVVHSHLHGDHVGWNVTDGKATFPRARYLVPSADWDHFTAPERVGDLPSTSRNVLPLQQLGVMDLVDDGHSVTDEITTISTPGHTPGHMTIYIQSQGEKGMVVGDVIQSIVQVMEPNWGSRADIDAEQARRSRESLVDRIEREEIVMAAGHFPTGTHFGRIVRVEGRRYWQVAVNQA